MSGQLYKCACSGRMITENATIDQIPESIAGATALAVEIVLGLITNSFVVAYSFCHPKSLKKSANLLLLNLSIANLLYCLLVLPFPIVTVAFGRYPYVESHELEETLCNICGYLFKLLNNVLVYIIAAISTDRCIFITRPFIHRRYVQPKLIISMIVVTWLLVMVMSSAPWHGFGAYEYNEVLYLCFTSRDRLYAIYTLTLYTVPVIVTVVTTIWTAVSTRTFLRRRRSRLASMARAGSIEQLDTNNVYLKQVRNLIGLFGLLLIIQAISAVPGVLLIIVNTTAPQTVPDTILRSAFILYNTHCIGSAIIQAYFRRDLNEYVRSVLKKLRLLSCSVAKGCNHSTSNLHINVSPMGVIQATIVVTDSNQHGTDSV